MPDVWFEFIGNFLQHHNRNYMRDFFSLATITWKYKDTIRFLIVMGYCIWYCSWSSLSSFLFFFILFENMKTRKRVFKSFFLLRWLQSYRDLYMFFESLYEPLSWCCVRCIIFISYILFICNPIIRNIFYMNNLVAFCS